MSTKIRPLYDQVLIKRTPVADQTASGLVIPKTATEYDFRGEVLAVGDGVRMLDGTQRPLTVKPGDVVLFGRRGWNEIKMDGEDYLIMRETEILAVVEHIKA